MPQGPRGPLEAGAASNPDDAGRGESWLRSAAKLAGGTAASRILGVIRDILRAYLFGTGIAADAFTVAFRLPNMLRALFAEGALSAAFVPVLTEAIEREPEREWKGFVTEMAAVLSLVVSLVALLGVLLAPAVVPLIVPGFGRTPGKIELTVSLTQTVFPYILFISMATLAMATLNSLRHFIAPAASAGAFNLVLIA